MADSELELDELAATDVAEEVHEGLNDKIQRFYEALRGSNNSFELIEALNNIEDHKPIIVLGETVELVNEFITDCQKKSAQVLRAPYAESVRNSISAFRKRLTSKVAKTAESSQQHGQRHLNTIIELLGSWSNVIAELESFYLSSHMIVLICGPLHSRVIDMAHECFDKFKEDKNIDSIQSKLHNQRRKSNANVDSSISLSSLDFLLSQMSAMRDIVNQYYKFIADKLGSDAFQEEVFVTQTELLRWRELDAVYSSLECSYLAMAADDALSVSALLEVEVNVLVPQCIEDLFFVTQRTIDRSLAVDSASIAMSIGNHLIALLDRHQDSQVYSLITDNKVFYRCRSQQFVNLPWAASDAKLRSDAAATSAVSLSSSVTAIAAGSSSTSVTVTASEAEIIESTVGGSVATDIGAELAELVVNKFNSSGLADIASASLAGVNSWLFNFASETTTVLDDTAPSGRGSTAPSTPAKSTQPAVTPSKSATPAFESSHMTPRTPTSTVKLEEVLLQALEDEVNETLANDEEGVVLHLEDYCVQLSSIAISASALSNLIDKFRNLLELRTNSFLGAKEHSLLAALSIIIQELGRCRQDYVFVMKSCAQSIAQTAFSNQLETKLRACLSSSYVIDGATMDQRVSECELSSAVKTFVKGSYNGYFAAEILAQLSSCAVPEISTQLAVILNDFLLATITTMKFNEWGALLLLDEVNLICQYLDDICEDGNKEVKEVMSQTKWAAKVLTLDQPGDIRRYNIMRYESEREFTRLDEQLIRTIMSCRVEFSKDVISKIKISCS